MKYLIASFDIVEAMSVSKIRLQAIGLLFGYGLQFLAGMTINLFVSLPKSHPGTSGNEYFSRSSHSLWWALSGGGNWALTVHAYLALGLVVGSLSLLIRAAVYKSKEWKWAGGVAALFTIGAFFNGLSFIDYSQDFSSMIMASCWLVAVGSLVYGLIRFQKA